ELESALLRVEVAFRCHGTQVDIQGVSAPKRCTFPTAVCGWAATQNGLAIEHIVGRGWLTSHLPAVRHSEQVQQESFRQTSIWLGSNPNRRSSSDCGLRERKFRGQLAPYPVAISIGAMCGELLSSTACCTTPRGTVSLFDARSTVTNLVMLR